jgi:hypothetical protein
MQGRKMSVLCRLADDLVQNRSSIADACTIAEETTAGSVRFVGGLRQRVLNSTRTVTDELSDLAAYIQKYPLEDPRRWAGTLLMVQAQLGAGNLGSVQNLVKRVVDVSGGVCPAAASDFATAMVDSLLSYSKFLSSRDIEWLQQIRSRFRRSKSEAQVDLVSSESTQAHRGEEERPSSSGNPAGTRLILILSENTDAAVVEFIKAYEIGELLKSLREHPELLSDRALEELQRIFNDQIDTAAKRKLAERIALLRRCRSFGLDEVFREYFNQAKSDDSPPPTVETDK